MSETRQRVRNPETAALPLLAMRRSDPVKTAKAPGAGAESLDPRAGEGEGRRLPYCAALDGLRGLAVIAVLLYHAGISWMPGGFLGVEVFFVLSGYLITALLFDEYGRSGRIDLRAFWARRARRLLPGLFVCMTAAVICAAVLSPGDLFALRGDGLSALAQVHNWYQVLARKSYFESIGRPSLLRHLWSLSLEAQFYLLWPLLFSFLASSLGRRALPAVVLGLAVVSALWMATLYVPGTDPSRVYYGTDTRCAGFLFGGALALVPGLVPAFRGTDPDLLALAGLCAMAALVSFFLFAGEFDAFLYFGGLSIVGLATTALISGVVVSEQGPAARLLAWGPLRWIGVRSYGIYLWHFPVFMVTRPQLDIRLDGVALCLVRIAITTVLAALSFRYVEEPVRRGAPARGWRALCQAQGDEKKALRLRWAAGAVAISIPACVGLAALATAEQPAPPPYLAAGSATALPADGSIAETPTRHSGVAQTAAPVADAEPAQAGTAATARELSVTAIGDSVMQGVACELAELLGTNLVVDTSEGRLPWHTPNIVRELRVKGRINPVVVLHIGDNGFFTARVLDRVMAELRDARHVVLVNVKVPRRWETANNKVLSSAVRRYSKVSLVDWNAASSDRPGLFWPDGIHLRPSGARLYAGLVADAVRAGPMPVWGPEGALARR